MNLIEHVVTEVKSQPYYVHMWCVDVMANSWGNVRPTTVYLQTEEEANKVDIGFKFEA